MSVHTVGWPNFALQWIRLCSNFKFVVMVENTWNQVWLSNFALKAWSVLQKSSLYARWNVKLAKGNEYSHVARRVLLVDHPQLHGPWLSTEKRTMTKEFVAEIFHRNFPVWFWWSSHKNLMENVKVLFQILCPWGSEVKKLCELTHSLPPSLGASEICGFEAWPHSLHCLAGRFWSLIVEGT